MESTENLPVEFSQKFFTEQDQEGILRRRLKQKSPETIDKLNKATPGELVKDRKGKQGKHFDYVEGKEYLQRVKTIDPHFEWVITTAPYMLGNVCICVGDLIISGVRCSGVGSVPIYKNTTTGVYDAEKRAEACETTAFKRAATKHGIFFDLYGSTIDEIDFDVDQNTGEIKDKEVKDLNEFKKEIGNIYTMYLNLLVEHGYSQNALDKKLVDQKIDMSDCSKKTYDKIVKSYDESKEELEKRSKKEPKQSQIKEDKKEEPKPNNPKEITATDVKKFHARLKDAGVEYDDTYRQSPLFSHYKVDSIEDISKDNYEKEMARLQSLIDGLPF